MCRHSPNIVVESYTHDWDTTQSRARAKLQGFKKVLIEFDEGLLNVVLFSNKN